MCPGFRAVRMVLDHGHECGSQWEAICSVADELGPKSETVRLWVRQAERNSGRRPGATTDELAELKRLKRENAELRRANDILKRKRDVRAPCWEGRTRNVNSSLTACSQPPEQVLRALVDRPASHRTRGRGAST